MSISSAWSGRCASCGSSSSTAWIELNDVILDLLRVKRIREDTYIRPLAYAADTSGKRFCAGRL